VHQDTEVLSFPGSGLSRYSVLVVHVRIVEEGVAVDTSPIEGDWHGGRRVFVLGRAAASQRPDRLTQAGAGQVMTRGDRHKVRSQSPLCTLEFSSPNI